ncbi:MAG: hypothetical protein ACPH3N_00810 [Alcanivorax sediminis]|uniref:hypothetical protein n=1 Tax=Alcanivorax sediminis TaxID=2663008 RepID=UPI003C36CB31
MAKVTGIGVAACDARRITLQSMLLNAAEVEPGYYGKGVLIMLDDYDEKYDVGYRNAGLSGSEMLALLEVVKTMILADMGYLPHD